MAVMANLDSLSQHDILYNTSLIDVNNVSIATLQSKIDNLVTILNSKLDLNINPNLL